jgi:anti-anti-sigma factor
MPPLPDSFSVRTEQHGGATVVVPHGELDLATAPALELALSNALAQALRVVLDLRELDFIDSSGLRTLLSARKRAEEGGAEFSLVAGDRGLERTLDIAGVRAIFAWTPASELGR